MLDLLLYFFIYSALGYLVETVYAYLIVRKYVVRRTMLVCPLCPVYGLGAVAMLLCLQQFSDNLLLLFCGGFLVCSGVEYLYSYFSELFFGVLWWDYRELPMQLHGRVCAFYSLIWGVFAIIFFKGIHPYISYLVYDMNTYYKILLGTIFSSVFISDFIETARELRKFARGEDSRVDGIFTTLKTAR